MQACLNSNEVEAFVAAELSSQDTSRFETHIASCPICREAVDTCRRDIELARGIRKAYSKIEVSDSDFTVGADGDRDGVVADSIDGYEILHEIHRGGQGVVYKAVQLATKRTVALKVLLHGPYASASQQHRFEREIDLVASLQHPNIVTIYDSGLTHGRNYFAMEYIHGRSLDTYLSDAGLSTDQTLRLFQKICLAVNAAHQRGVIHRDLKPGNIRVDSEGEPHILDFGLAKTAGPNLQGGVPVTISGEFMGTLAYASPEQTKGDPRLVDIRTDVYSLGVILFEMLTGQYPYPVTGHMAEVLRNIAEVEPPRPSAIRRAIGDEVDTIVLKALAKEKERRYQSAETLASDVGHYLAGEPLDAKRDSTWYVLRKSLRRYRMAAGVAAAFVLILAAATVALSVMYRNQSVAREEAETARRAEQEQRTLAEERTRQATAAKELALRRETEAIEARAETQKRADELEVVTEFQQSMLGQIDAGEMGRALYADLRARVRESLEKEGVEPERREAAVAEFDRTLRRANATDVALALLDEQVLGRAVEAIESKFADQPVVRAALQQTVANVYRDIGRYPPAMELQEAALGIRRAELGDTHRDTLDSINNTGILLQAQGRLAEAATYYREALRGCRQVLGDEHPDTLRAINNMGYLLSGQGKFAEAEPYYREALQTKRRVLGDEHPDTLSSINNMGALLESQGKLVEAEPYYREALQTKRRVLGNEHPDTLLSINNMGFLLHRQGKLAEAEPYYREGLDGLRRALGNQHPHTLASINNIGALLQGQGKLTEAEEFLREGLDGLRRVLGDEHPNTLRAINNVGGVLKQQGKLEEAELHFREALQGCRRVLGTEHPSTLTSMNNLGSVLREQGKLTEAETYFRETLEARRRLLGDEHRDTLKSVTNMAVLLIDQGNYAEAAAMLVPTEATARQAFTGGTMAWMGGFLVALGRARVGLGFEPERFALGEANLMEAHRILVETRGATHDDTHGCVQGLIDLYDAWHEAEPDAGYDAKAAEWRSKLEGGAGHPFDGKTRAEAPAGASKP